MVRYQHPFNNPDLADGWGSWAGGRTQAHRGLDYPQASGTPIPAVATGTVVHNGWNAALGWVLVIAHADGMYSGYSHMVAQSPKTVGTAITRGQTIGNVGTTGSASGGNHLHLTIAFTEDGTWNNGDISVTTDPWTFINARLNAPENGDDMAKSYPTRDDYRTSIALAAGASQNLKNSSGSDMNITDLGDAGRVVVTAHVYANAPAGTAVEIAFLWQTASSGAISPHFTERVVAGADGKIRANPTFQSSLSSGSRIFLRVGAPSTNTATVTVTELQADATLFQ